MLKYDIIEKQHMLDLDNKKIEMEKGLIDMTKEKQNEFSKITKEAEFNLKNTRNEKMLWES